MIVYHELASIERELGVSAKTLYALSNSLSRHYHRVELPKSGGGTRSLFVPDEELKRVQRAIAEHLLPLEPVSRYATAYRIGGGILQNAFPHVGQKQLLKLDILRFFDSIRYSEVKEKVFPASRYSEKIRILLSMLCYYRDVLPQGAPTSPAVSNIILREFDLAVGRYCRSRGIVYTRYCDDMTFSGAHFDVDALISLVEGELRLRGFLLNRRKIKAPHRSERRIVTGIVVNEKPNVPREYRRQIRSELHYIETFGISSHLERMGSLCSPRDYLCSLLGRIRFVLQVSPTDKCFLAYAETVARLLREADA